MYDAETFEHATSIYSDRLMYEIFTAALSIFNDVESLPIDQIAIYSSYLSRGNKASRNTKEICSVSYVYFINIIERIAKFPSSIVSPVVIIRKVYLNDKGALYCKNEKSQKFVHICGR